MMIIKTHYNIDHQGRRRTHHPRSAGQLMELNKPQPRWSWCWWYFIIKIDDKHDYVDFDVDNDDFDDNASGPRGCWIWWLENNFHNQVSSPYLLPFYHFVAIFAMLLPLLSLCCHICRHFCHCIVIFTIYFVILPFCHKHSQQSFKSHCRGLFIATIVQIATLIAFLLFMNVFFYQD